ncbi:hypothetical protein ACWDE9_47860, partial [Streptomyces olivaceoviridis]
PLARERSHLAASRAALRAMREDVEALDISDRCLRLELPVPDEERLRTIVAAHLGEEALRNADDLIDAFLRRRALGELATDQLLNAVFLRTGGVDLDADGLLNAVLHQLTGAM